MKNNYILYAIGIAFIIYLLKKKADSNNVEKSLIGGNSTGCSVTNLLTGRTCYGMTRLGKDGITYCSPCENSSMSIRQPGSFRLR